MEYIKYLTIILVAIYSMTNNARSQQVQYQNSSKTYAGMTRATESFSNDKMKMYEIKNKIYANKQIISQLNSAQSSAKISYLRTENENLYKDFFRIQNSILDRYNSK
jgi:hypothetical protein